LIILVIAKTIADLTLHKLERTKLAFAQEPN
jgi:hypothetical protein